MKKYLLLAVSVLAICFISIAQTQKSLTIDSCYVLARQYYPMVKQKDLIEKSKEYSIDNASKGYLPQVNFNGQATHQSDVTQIPISLPNITIPTVSKDQYKIYGEISEPLTDLVVIKQQKELLASNATIQEQQLEVELYKIKDRINQLYFGTLLIDEQLKQTSLLKKDIQSGIDKMNSAIANGIALKSSADGLKAELLKADQHNIELKASRKAYIDMLSLFVNQPLNENTQLEKPQNKIVSSSINRPELIVFDSQKKSFDIQNKLITAKNVPRLGLFFQAGLGNPSPVNIFKNELSDYYIGGVRFSWSLTGLYTMKRERQLLDVNSSMYDVQREVFLFNTNFTLKQQDAEISKMQELIKSDNDIIVLRSGIKNTANSQLQNGIITANDYLHEVNAEDQARQNLLLHQVQLLMAQYNYQTTSGN